MPFQLKETNLGNFGVRQRAENNLCGISSQKVGTALVRSTGFTRIIRACVLLGWCLCAGAVASRAQQSPVIAQIQIAQRGKENKGAPGNRTPDSSNVVVWLTPLDRSGKTPDARARAQRVAQLVQRNKNFEPHLLVVEVGSEVQFPNKDPFFHNVFSLFNGRRFDLGLYEAGTSRSVRFDHPGVSFLFCNIHAEMSAVVISIESRYFGISDGSGRVTLPDVPDGRYQLQVWYERSLPEDLKSLSRAVTISPSSRTLDPIQVTDNPDFKLAHKNKYGQDYVPPATPSYSRP
jgi:plastocyanin